MKADIQQRVTDNIARVRNMITIYEKHLMGKGSGRRGHLQTDILRAATVFLHASLEDFLRNIAYWKLPDAPKEVIDKIPLVGSGRNASKFWLGDLVAHKGKKIDVLIKESVDEHLERSNYNNTEDLSIFLNSVGIDSAVVNGRFKDLEQLMSRRHQIVHRGDIDEHGGRGNSRIRSLGRSSVNVWILAVEEFSTIVLEQL